MRVGLVGYGFIADTHAAAWRALGAERLLVQGPDPDRAAAFATRHSAEAVASLDELLAACDLVDVCSPTDRHREAVLAAAGAGRHVICEKPIARSVADAEAMADACRAAGVRFFVAHVVRYFPEYASAQRDVAGGRIGRPAIVRLRREAFRPRRPPDHWLWHEALSGGVILDLMIHDFDYARWIAGEVETVMARRVEGVPEVDYAIAILRHASGALSHVTGAWAYPAPVFRTGFELAGDGGLIEWESVDAEPIRSYLPTPSADAAAVGLPSSPTDDDPFTVELADFTAAIERGTEPRVGVDDAIAALRIALSAIGSAGSGRPVAPSGIA